MSFLWIWLLFMLVVVGCAQDTFCVRFGMDLPSGYHNYVTTNTPPNPTSQLLSDMVLSYDVQFECAKNYTSSSGAFVSSCYSTNNTYIAVSTNYTTGFFDILSSPWTASTVKLSAGSQSGQWVTTTEFTATINTSKWPLISSSINQIIVQILLNGTSRFDGNFSANIPKKVMYFTVGYYFGADVFNIGAIKPSVAPCQSPASFLTPWTNSPAFTTTPSGGVVVNRTTPNAASTIGFGLAATILFAVFVLLF